MFFTDRLTLDSPRKTDQGFLVASVRAARTGIQHYAGREVDPDNEHGMRDAAQVAVYRDEAEVFSVDSLKSFSVLDVTVDHPSEPVTADNWRDYAVGVTGEEVVRDGQFIRIPMMLKDAAAIRVVEGGKRELSVGYSTKLVWEKGVTADGLTYDAKQTHIRANHISVVGAARGGKDLRIGDGKTMKTIIFDGISIEVTDQAEQAITKLQGQVTKLISDAATATTAHASAIAAKDAELAKKDGEIDGLKAKVLDAAALDAAVKERADLIAKAKAIHDADYSGKSALDIRKAALAAKGIALDGKSDAYIEARFDALVDASPDALRDAIAQVGGSGGSVAVLAPTSLADMRAKAEAAHAKQRQELADAYKTAH